MRTVALAGLLGAIVMAACSARPTIRADEAEPLIPDFTFKGDLDATVKKVDWKRLEASPGRVTLAITVGDESAGPHVLAGRIRIYMPDGTGVMAHEITPGRSRYELSFLIEADTPLYVRLEATHGKAPYTLIYRFFPMRDGPKG